MDRNAFTEGFISETKEHLDAINNGTINLKNNPKDRETLADVLRHLHTIKGTSRMLGYPVIEQLSHGLEDVFKGIREEKYDLTDLIVQLTFATSDKMRSTLSEINQTGSDSCDISKFTETFQKAASGLFFSVVELNEKNAGSEDKSKDDNASLDDLENITSIRIDIKRINDIIRSFDNLIIRQFRFKNQLEQFRETVAIPKQLQDDLALIETAIFETQHQILDLRMLPLDMILNPLRREIETDTVNLGKKIIFSIPTNDFMLDKVILEQLHDILLHLVRNSIDHGIETEEQRLAAGKSAEGHITVGLQQVNNHIRITISDDGRGIQYDKIRKKAMNMFPKQAKEIADMDEKDLQQYIFMSGFTTKDNPTALSGRGVGLDVVRNGMEKIKGRIRVITKNGEGTTFELTIPLSLATQQGLFVRAGNQKFLVPSHYIREILDAEEDKIAIIQGQRFIKIGTQYVPLYHISSVFGIVSTETSNDFIVIVLEYLGTMVGMIVDAIEQYENVVVTPLPPIMKGMDSLQGVVYDENYAIIPIVDIPDVMQRMKGLLSYDIKKYDSKNKKRIYTVLVVDDSPTTRQIEQTIFETDGYIVETAQDGIEALAKMKEKHVDAIITDMKMPRMDGLVFLSNIRRMEEYENTPVVIVSGVYDPEVKTEFMEAGAQAFIVKSEFQRGNLLQAVKELLGE